MKEVIINDILDEAREMGVSDVHFTAGLPPIFRLHGELVKSTGYPEATEPIIVNVINAITSVKHKQIIAKGEDADFSYVTAAGFRHRRELPRHP